MIIFYMHAGSMNHGCEAIVRSTISIINSKKVFLYSNEPKEDETVNIDKICEVKAHGGKKRKTNPSFIFYKIVELVLGDKPKFRYLYRNLLKEARRGNFYLSIGGDNYCYSIPQNHILAFLNEELNKKGCKTALWGCSIEPKLLEDIKVLEDLRRYDFISARESITFEALKKYNANKHIYLYPDPAFVLETEEVSLPDCFNYNNVIGINISPLICNEGEDKNIAYENYRELVNWVLTETDMTVVFIPHVCKSDNDDRVISRQLIKEFNSDRVLMINESNKWNCSQIKFAISKCRFIVTARTHASIAAYSSMIPTLVVGYSVKARGIAKDIFGTYEKYVLNIQDVVNNTELKDAFIWVYKNEIPIKNSLQLIIPQLVSKTKEIKKILMKYDE